MAAKTKIDLYFDSSVAANSTDLQTSSIIPNGISVSILAFGGSDPFFVGDGSVIALQWGSGGTWQTIWAFAGTMDFTREKEFAGDGSKRFRLVRQNKSLALAKTMVVWLEAIIQDA